MCGCTCAKHSVKYRIGCNTKITFHSFRTSHTRCYPVKCTTITARNGKDAQLLVSIGHVTVSQSDLVTNTICNTATCNCTLYANLHLVSLSSGSVESQTHGHGRITNIGALLFDRLPVFTQG